MGIVPIKIDRLDKIKLETYRRWVNNGKPKDDNDQPLLYNEEGQLEGEGQLDGEEDERQLEAATETETATPMQEEPEPGCSSWITPSTTPQPRASTPNQRALFHVPSTITTDTTPCDLP